MGATVNTQLTRRGHKRPQAQTTLFTNFPSFQKQKKEGKNGESSHWEAAILQPRRERERESKKESCVRERESERKRESERRIYIECDIGRDNRRCERKRHTPKKKRKRARQQRRKSIHYSSGSCQTRPTSKALSPVPCKHFPPPPST